MSDSFIVRKDARQHPQGQERNVLVTGAAGNIGSYFVNHAPERYTLRLMVHPDADPFEISERGTIYPCLLGDREKLGDLCEGIDTVVHLAADPSPSAPWDSVVSNNIKGTFNVFDAAAAAGCRRVVFASSIHAVSGYPSERQVQDDDPVSPGDLYGVSKCFGEALARFMATQRGLSAICIRIGAYQPRSAAEEPDSLGMINAFASHRDLCQLICCAVDNESLHFAIVHGLSNNTFNRMNVASARELLGYDPQDDFVDLNERLRQLDLKSAVAPKSETGGT